MADVVVEMETGMVSVHSEPMPVGQKPRGYKLASAEAKAALREADKKKRAAAEARGPWKDATPAQQREAWDLVAAVEEARQRVIDEHGEGVKREQTKREAAAERERRMSEE